jgi:N-acetyltransferase
VVCASSRVETNVYEAVASTARRCRYGSFARIGPRDSIWRTKQRDADERHLGIHAVAVAAHSVCQNESTNAVAFDLQPHLKGELIELRPLALDDWDELFAVASDSLIWEQHPESDRYKKDVFKAFFRDALKSRGAFVIIDTKTRRVIGSTRFYGYDPEKSEIEIGWTFLARKYWGGRYNREMKQLLLAHAFKFVETVVFLVGEHNIRSQRAMEKIGAIKVGAATRAYGHHPPATNVKYVIRKSEKVES